VRSLLFGANRPFETHLGFKVAAFNAPGYRHRDEGAYVSYCVPGKQIARYALRDDRTGFLFVFRAKRPTAEFMNEEEKRALLQETFSGIGWECAEILRALDRTPHFYFDDVSQVRMPTWSRGRIALVGDAAFCPSLLAGEGSSLAMAAGYLLAGELKRSGGDGEQAFQRYQELLKPPIDRKQKAATRLGGWFAPKTAFGVFARNAMTGLMKVPLIAHWTFGRMIADQFELPDYDQVS
jgi:2-polyprenyl-6-methoxyphenol hydroxylase-like FAD-dependent oxidoreductase